MKIEVQNKIIFKEDEKWRITLHSFYNLIQVLFTEVNILKQILGESDNLENALEQIQHLKDALTDPQSTISSLNNLSNFKSNIFHKIDQAVNNSTALKQQHLNDLEESLNSFDRVIRIVEARTDDFLRLIVHNGEWVNFDTALLTDKMKDVFKTMEVRSKGRYGVTFEKSTRKDSDYFIDIDLASAHEEVLLPALFPDVIRDLTANAKKYSTPGKTINCRLSVDNNAITLQVRDNGRGIPSDDLPNVVNYGFRASNVLPEETFGDGFGLTKAYLITSEHDGKMWIDSIENQYTEISIEIPYPAK